VVVRVVQQTATQAAPKGTILFLAPSLLKVADLVLRAEERLLEVVVLVVLVAAAATL
jgi:hypothetical protein